MQDEEIIDDFHKQPNNGLFAHVGYLEMLAEWV